MSAPADDLEAAYLAILHRTPKRRATPQMLAEASNPLEALYYGHQGRQTSKWAHYLEVYDRHLSRFRDTPARLLEIGVRHGGSLQLWRKYLGETAQVHGLDINPRVAGIDDPDLRVHVGDQADAAVLDAILAEAGGLDVVIDDGSHVSSDQIATFEHLFPRLADGGVYVCEDLHASYWPWFGGAPGKPGTFVEYLKGLIDVLHHPYVEDRPDAPDWLAHVHSLAVYDSIAVVEKRAPRDRLRIVCGHQLVEDLLSPVAKPDAPV